MNTDKHKTIKTILTALTLKQKQLEHTIHTLKTHISNKQKSITTLENYATEYNNNFYKTLSHRVNSFLNHQQFLDKLTKVLYSEKQELIKLEAQHMEQLTEYHMMTRKIDGIDDMLTSRHEKDQALFLNNEDIKRSELATTRACQQRIETHE